MNRALKFIDHFGRVLIVSMFVARIDPKMDDFGHY